MDNIDQLFIRACKSKEPDKRLESLVRRFYMTGSKTNKSLIISILSVMCDNHCPIKISKLTNLIMSPSYLGVNPTTEIRVYTTLKNHFRYMEIKNLNLDRTPAMFRSKL